LVHQLFEAGGIFEDSLREDGILFFDMAVGKIL